MAYTPPFLKVDKTGRHPDNYIIGEVQSPPLSRQRLLIPIYGAFFADDFSLVDEITNTTVDPALYSFSDLDTHATEESGKSVYTCVVLEQGAPSAVRLSYHAYGGPGSRNASFLVNWLSERSQLQGRTIEWDAVQDKPKRFKPSDHKHLLAHIYGTESLNEALARLERAIEVGHESMWIEYNFQIDRKLDQLAKRSEILAIALAQEFFRKAQQEYTLFSIGVDLLENYPILGERGALIAPGDFVMDTQDEAYVDLKGLGSFSKALAKRIVSSDETNLGLDYGVYWEPKRGMFLAAPVGAVFILPAQKTIQGTMLTNIKVYPDNFPVEDEFLVEKIATSTNDLSALFRGYNTRTGDTYTGLLTGTGCSKPLVWSRNFTVGENIDLSALMEDHAKANNNPHDDHKDKIGLRYLENLPVVTEDEILLGEGVRKYVTLDAALFHILKTMEGVKLERDPDGNIDYTKNTMHDQKIVFAPCDTTITKDGKPAFPGDIPAGQYTGPKFPPKGQFLKSFCDGSDKYTSWTDGAGSYYDELTDKNSDDCNFKEVPRQGEMLSEYCQNQNRYKRYADGRGGTYQEITRINDPECGYVAKDPEGKVLAEFCRNKDLYTRYADGNGYFYELPTMVNASRCGGEIYPLTSLGGGTGENNGTGSSGKPKLKFASTHSKIYGGTQEILSFYASNLTPGQNYNVDWWIKSPALNNNADYKSVTTSFTASDRGDYIYERTEYDNGSAVPRGVYDNWLEVTILDLVSNHITREFLAGKPPTDDGSNPPNSGSGQENAGGAPAGSGNGAGPAPGETPKTPTDVNGNPMTSIWPPPSLFDPKIVMASSHGVIRIGDNEIMSVQMTGFMAAKTYNLQVRYSSPAVASGAPQLSYSENVVTFSNGTFRLELPLYDSGVTPRGTYDNWATVGSYESNHIDRIFTDEPRPNGYMFDPKVSLSASHAVVSKNMAYSHTVVLTGFEKNREVALSVNGTYYGTWVTAFGMWSVVIVTKDDGSYRYDRNMLDDGVSTPRKSYRLVANATPTGTGGKVYQSNTAWQDFVDTPVDNNAGQGTGYAKISYTSTQSTISWTEDETQTILLTQGIKGAEVQLQFWAQSPALWDNKPSLMTTERVTLDANGNGKATLVTRDNGMVVPRGDYTCWAACPEYNLLSSKIIRKFVVNPSGTPAPSPTPAPAPGQTPAPTNAPTPAPNPIPNALLNFSTNTPTIEPGVTETMTTTLSGFLPNTVYAVEYWIQSEALNNGFTAIKSFPTGQEPTVTTNSQGAGTHTYSVADNGTTPRGIYSCWVIVGGKVSAKINRTFVNKQAPAPTYKPTLVYESDKQTLYPGTIENSKWTMRGGQPGKTVTIDWIVQASTFNGGAAYRTLQNTAVLDGNGFQTMGMQVPDSGSMPRGDYYSWVECPEYNLASAKVVRYFRPTPTPTEPPFNPQVSFSTSLSTIRVGNAEQFIVNLSGMKPNQTYTVGIWAQSPALWNNAASEMMTVQISTNSSGIGFTSWWTTDNGATPRGTYRNWATCNANGVSVSSSVFTRVFA